MTSVQGKSTRECERILQPQRSGTTLHLTVDDATYADLKRVSELKGISMSDLPRLIKEIAALSRRILEAKKSEKKVAGRSMSSVTLGPTIAPAQKQKEALSRYVPAQIKRAVWLRDGSHCTFISPITKRRCDCRFRLEIDHIIPLSCGGKATLENLRLLCRSHNKLAANRVFGRAKIEQHRPKHN